MSAIQFNSAKYDKKHARLLSKNGKKLRALYDAFYQQVAVIGSTIPHADGELYLRDYPAAQQAMYALLKQLSREITHVAEEGNEEAWDISDAKNSRLIASLGLDKATVDSLQGKVTRRSESALKAFQGRKVNGMGLSERVWALHKGVMPQIEMALELGLAQGRSAASLSRDVREYLNEPNKLFRRVRDKDGVLRLSKAAAAYHPGRGVYRSSYKNALRLTATENNMAYRSADHAQWGGMDFVIGVEIGLSGNHPVADICDELKGVYPKEFKFTGWHPFCRCFATPKLPSREEMNKWARMSDKERAAYEFEGTVKDMPKGYNDWITDNAERIASAKSVPYFIKDNYVGGKVGRVLVSESKDGVSEKSSPFAKLKDCEKKLRRDTKKETAAVYNSKGKLLFVEEADSRTPYGVGFTEEQFSMMNNSVLTHSHIKGSYYPVGDMRRIGNSFSLDDIVTAAKGNLSEIHAVTENYTFIAKRPTSGWLLPEDIKIVYKDIESEVRCYFEEMKANGIWTQKQTDTVYYHTIMRKLSEKTGIGYEKKCNIKRE